MRAACILPHAVPGKLVSVYVHGQVQLGVLKFAYPGGSCAGSPVHVPPCCLH